MSHGSNLWDKEQQTGLFMCTWPLRFTDTLKIKNIILMYLFLPTPAVCVERGCAVNFSRMLSNYWLISILPQLTTFKAPISSCWASKTFAPAWSCQVKTLFFFFFQHTQVQQSYLGLSLLPAFILAPSNGEQEEAVAGTQR